MGATWSFADDEARGQEEQGKPRTLSSGSSDRIAHIFSFKLYLFRMDLAKTPDVLVYATPCAFLCFVKVHIVTGVGHQASASDCQLPYSNCVICPWIRRVIISFSMLGVSRATIFCVIGRSFDSRSASAVLPCME